MYSEIWMDIPSLEGRYLASNHGRIRSLAAHYSSAHILKQRINNAGYAVVDVRLSNGKRKSCYVHRLVAEAFLPNPDHLPQVNHIDENKLNNSIDNLEYCDRHYNMSYGSQPIIRSTPVGAYRNGRLAMSFKSQKEAVSAGFRQSSISLCIQGKIGSHKGYQWRKIG